MAKDDENKSKFSSTSRMLQKAIKPSNDQSINEKNLETHLPDELKSMSNLSPDSQEFKRRINEERLKYFMELNHIYLINILLTKQTQQETRDKNEFLAKYIRHLEEIKQFFQNLSPEKSLAEKLSAEQAKRLELYVKKLEEGISVLTRQINQLNVLIQKTDEDIKKLIEERQNQKLIFSNTIKEYFADDKVMKNAKKIILSVQYEEAETSKSSKIPVRELILNETHIRAIMRDVADKIMKDEFSLGSQANDIQNTIRQHLHNEAKNLASFLSEQEKEKFAHRFMNSQEAARGIDIISTIINDHTAEQEEKHHHKLKSTEKTLANLDSELHAKFEEKQYFETFRESLEEKKEMIEEAKMEAKNFVKEDGCPKSFLVNLEATSNDFDDIFSDDTSVSKLIDSITKETFPEEAEEADRFTPKMT